MTTAALNSIDAGNLEHALDLLERAVSVDGTAGYAFAYLGYLYAESGRADQALAFVDQALSLLPPEPAVSGELIELRSFAASQRER
jgi:Flp pilus assembly protein TadD